MSKSQLIARINRVNLKTNKRSLFFDLLKLATRKNCYFKVELELLRDECLICRTKIQLSFGVVKV